MWFGTQDGLNRYDGYSFTVYKHDAFDPHSLSDNSIRALCEDHYGALWIGTDFGLNRFDHDSDRFTRFLHDPAEQNSLSDNQVLALEQDHTGALWIGTSKGLNKFDPGKDLFTRFFSNPDDPTALTHDLIRVIHEDSNHVLWVGLNNEGLHRFDRATGKFKRYRRESDNLSSLSDNRIRALTSDRTGLVWIGTWDGGLCAFDPVKERFVRFVHDRNKTRSISHNTVMSIYEDRKGMLWIGTVGGLNVFDRSTKEFTRINRTPTDPRSLSGDYIVPVYEDRSGTIWIGTLGAGINRYDPSQEQFTHIVSLPGTTSSLIHNNVWSIIKDRSGMLWIGTDGGLDRFDRATNRFTHFVHDPLDHSSLSSNNVRTICEDQSGAMWIATWGGGLNRLETYKNRFKRFLHDPEDPQSLGSDLVLRIYEDHSGTIWIGSVLGLDRFDPATQQFIRIPLASNDKQHTDRIFTVSAIFEDHQSMIWIGTQGLIVLDPITGQKQFFFNDPHDSTTLSINRVFAIHEDRNHILWIGTGGGGLERFDRSNKQFIHYTEKDGLPNNTVYGILEDTTGHLWLSTNNGISRFDPSRELFKNYDVSDGLQSNEFNDGAFHLAGDGELFFGGINGVTAFYPWNIQEQSSPPQIVFTSFKVFNKEVKLQPAILEADRIELSHTSDFFSFEFAALHYANPRKNQYSYTLDGFDEDWIYSGTKREATYTNLDPGEYTFRVKGSNKDGIWNEAGASVHIVILPPFWQTWWFRGAVIIAVAVLAWTLHLYRVRKLLEVERVRTSIATELHDDIGSGLTRIAVLSDVMKKQITDLITPDQNAPESRDTKSIMNSASKIGNSARELHDAMSDVVWSLNPIHDTVESFVHRAKMFAVEMCEGKEIHLDFSVDGGVGKVAVPPTVLRNLLLFTKEAITNAVRHAQCSTMKIAIGASSGELRVTIADDGRGFDHTADSAGSGLKNMRIRAQKLGAKLTLDSAPGKGTTISMVIPRG
jgi:ligand-binding sensor domain-containing protein/signal transduction histidine kinase